MKPLVCWVAAALVLATIGAATALDRKSELEVLSYRAIDEFSVAEIMRAARERKLYGFEVQGLTAIAPTADGNARIAVCYWLGDMQHIDAEARCGIHFILGSNGKLLPDPATLNLSNAILTGRQSFEVALQIEYGIVCGTDVKRQNRKC